MIKCNIKKNKKIGIALGISLTLLFLLTMFTSTLYYFDIMGSKIFIIMELIIPLLSFLIDGIMISKKSKNKGWLEGLKLGIILVILLLLISFLEFEVKFSINQLYIIYYNYHNYFW